MKSMTGYGRVKHLSPELEIEISLRAVNGRFLELRFHMPREYARLEADFKRLLSQRLSRGTIDIFINRRLGAKADAVDIMVQSQLARKWLSAYQQMAQELKLKEKPSLEMIARIPDVFKLEEHAEISDDEKALILELLQQATMACEAERRREGKSLQSEILRLLAALEERVGEMEAMRADANRELEKKYRERLERLGLTTAVDDQRLAQEIIIQIDRTDISEEVQRLKEHVKTYRELVQGAESQGKKLDFYAQELLREVNTIGSKSHISSLTNAVVDAKAIVERIREQVQNAE